jgi:hypothetical protein
MTAPSAKTCVVAFGSKRRKAASWASAGAADPIKASTAETSRSFIAPPISCEQSRSQPHASALRPCRFDNGSVDEKFTINGLREIYP